MTLTLQTLKDYSLYTGRWGRLFAAVGNDLTTELSIGDVLIINGLDDALRCLQCLEPRVRVTAIMPAVKRVSVYTTDRRVHDCIGAIERWLAGDDTVDLDAAGAAAREAREAKAAGRAAMAAAEAGAEAKAALAAEAAKWAAWLAGSAAGAAEAEWASERKLQEADLLAMFPPMILKGRNDE
jgi:hypothetical protein